MSLMPSFVLSFFPRDVLDEIWDVIEPVSEGFPTYSCDDIWIRNTDRDKSVHNSDKSIPIKPNIEDFCKLETTGKYDSPLHDYDKRIFKSFHETLRYEGGRY